MAVTGYGVFNRSGEPPRVGFRRGDEVFDLSSLGDVFRRRSLNPFMAEGREAWAETLRALVRERTLNSCVLLVRHFTCNAEIAWLMRSLSPTTISTETTTAGGRAAVARLVDARRDTANGW